MPPEKLRELSVELFSSLYFEQMKTVKEIADMFGVSRVALYKWLHRQKPDLSADLQHRGKAAKYTLNEALFDTWSPEMAYVLGVLATDGNVRKYRVQLNSVDLELVQKVRNLIGRTYPIREIAPRGWSRKTQYSLGISSVKLARTLTELGVGAAKSLTLTFPDIPDECVRHFLRGCWDGDGSFYFESPHRMLSNSLSEVGTAPVFKASFVSGSKEFIQGFVNRLQKAGIKPLRRLRPLVKHTPHGRRIVRYWDTVRIYETSRGKNVSYSFRLTGPNAFLFAEFIYGGVPQSMYLTRKFDLYRQAVASSPSLIHQKNNQMQESTTARSRPLSR
jgi:LAGLIDADG DNA endonuclease family protein